jgi:hypothetical protein
MTPEKNGRTVKGAIIVAMASVLFGYAVAGFMENRSQSEQIFSMQKQIADHLAWANARNEKLEALQRDEAVTSSKIDGVIEELKEIKLELRKFNR